MYMKYLSSIARKWPAVKASCSLYTQSVLPKTQTRAYVTQTTKTKLRPYQQRIVSEIQGASGNAIVVLPTGTGKTLIASALLLEEFVTGASNNKRVAALFLVPTCNLVDQQAASIECETTLRVARFSGQHSLPKSGSFDTLVSTPEAFSQLQAGPETSFHLASFTTVVFDEVHHVVKRHPYRMIARLLTTIPNRVRPQVIGLSATLTYKVGNNEIQRAIEDLCSELEVTTIVSATHDELVKGGYHGQAGLDCKVVLPDLTPPHHVLPEIDSWTSPTGSLFKTHQMRGEFFAQIELGIAHPLSLALMECVATFEKVIAQNDSNFVSPLHIVGKKGKCVEWGRYAHQCAVDNGKSTNNLRRAYEQLEHLYEAVRIAVNSRQEDIELSYIFLIMMGQSVGSQYGELELALKSLMARYSLHHDRYGPNIRLNNLAKQLKVQGDSFGETLRCIIFVQQRAIAHVVQWFIEQNADLRNCMRIDSGVVYATSTPATASLRLTNTESKQRMEKFRTGELNILVTTSVSEEGMDVPAANCVIRFDAIQTPVSPVQSRGRARQNDSDFVVLAESTQANRTVAHLQEAEHHQYNILTTKQFDCANANTPTSQKRRLEANTNRQKRAKAVLSERLLISAAPAYIQLLNTYIAQSAGELIENLQMENGQWMCSFAMLVPDKPKFSVSASGSSKQAAKTRAAQKLVESILV